MSEDRPTGYNVPGIHFEGGTLVERFIVYGYPHFVRLLLAVWAALLWTNRRPLARLFGRAVSRRCAWGIAAVTLTSLVLRTSVIDHVHWAFMDEVRDMNLARNISRLGAYGESLVGGRADYDVLLAPPYWPCAFHSVLGLLYSVFGCGESAAFWLNTIIGGLTPGLICLASLLLFADETAALAGGGLLCFLPVHVKYSGAADLTVFSCFWLIATLLAFLIHRAERRDGSYLLFAATLAVCVHARPENAVLILLFAPVLHGYRRGPLRAGVWAFLALAAAPILGLIAVNSAVAAREFGSTAFGLWANIWRNVPANIGVLVKGYPVLIGCSVWGAWKYLKREGIGLMAAWLAAFLLVYSAFGNGRFGAWTFDRYSMALFVPLTLYAGAGLARRRVAAGLLIAACLFSFGSTYRSLTNFPLDEDKKYRFLRDCDALLPRDLYIISYSPATVISILDRPSVRTSFILSNKIDFERAISKQGRRADLILFKDFWWYNDDSNAALVEKTLSRDYDSELLVERVIGKVPYSFHRLRPKASHAS